MVPPSLCAEASLSTRDNTHRSIAKEAPPDASDGATARPKPLRAIRAPMPSAMTSRPNGTSTSPPIHLGSAQRSTCQRGGTFAWAFYEEHARVLVAPYTADGSSACHRFGSMATELRAGHYSRPHNPSPLGRRAMPLVGLAGFEPTRMPSHSPVRVASTAASLRQAVPASWACRADTDTALLPLSKRYRLDLLDVQAVRAYVVHRAHLVETPRAIVYLKHVLAALRAPQGCTATSAVDSTMSTA